jgi:hypothetical protein
LHDLLHESDHLPGPEKSSGNGDGRGEREQGFRKTGALWTIRHDGFLRRSR